MSHMPPTPLVLRLLLGFDEVHLPTSDAQHAQVNDSTLGPVTQVGLVNDVGFGFVRLEHKVFQSKEFILLCLCHSLKRQESKGRSLAKI